MRGESVNTQTCKRQHDIMYAIVLLVEDVVSVFRLVTFYDELSFIEKKGNVIKLHDLQIERMPPPPPSHPLDCVYNCESNTAPMRV